MRENQVKAAVTAQAQTVFLPQLILSSVKLTAAYRLEAKCCLKYAARPYL